MQLKQLYTSSFLVVLGSKMSLVSGLDSNPLIKRFLSCRRWSLSLLTSFCAFSNRSCFCSFLLILESIRERAKAAFSSSEGWKNRLRPLRGPSLFKFSANLVRKIKYEISLCGDRVVKEHYPNRDLRTE